MHFEALDKAGPKLSHSAVIDTSIAAVAVDPCWLVLRPGLKARAGHSKAVYVLRISSTPTLPLNMYTPEVAILNHAS